MKVLLVNAPYIKLYGPLNVGGNFQFPLGLGYIAGYLRANGVEVRLLDPEAQGMGMQRLKREAEEFGADAIGISCATPNFPAAVSIAKELKRSAGAPVILGGVHASAFPGRIASLYPEFDYVAAGEGERTMLEICESLEGKRPPESVKGLSFKGPDGSVVTTPAREPIEGLDELPFPARDLIPTSVYRPQVYADLGKKSVSMITSRGCPAACTFCASHLTMGRRFRTHGVEYMIAEIEECVRRFGTEYFVMKDDTFTCDAERLERFCGALIDRKLGVEWFCYSRTDMVDRGKLDLMRRAGCRIIAFGLESGSEKVLRGMRKGATVEDGRRTLQLANEMGFITVGSFILGGPGEDEESARATVSFAIETGPVLASFNRFVPYPGTPAFESIFPGGKFEEPRNWSDYVASGPNIAVESGGLSRQRLQRLTLSAYFRFYVRPGQWLWILRHLRSGRHLIAYLRGAAAVIMQMGAWAARIAVEAAGRRFRGKR